MPVVPVAALGGELRLAVQRSGGAQPVNAGADIDGAMERRAAQNALQICFFGNVLPRSNCITVVRS